LLELIVDAIKELAEKDPELARKLASEIMQASGGPPLRTRDLMVTQNSLLVDPVTRPALSVIFPVFNEEDTIPELYRRLKSALPGSVSFEVIFVDDGSTDKSAEIIINLRAEDPAVKLLRFSRNFGHQAAISAGIDHCLGDAVALMDADLQDPPDILPKMLELWREGAEVVYAVRQNRKEGGLKRFAYYSFYRLLQVIANIDIQLDSGDFCLMDRKVVDQLRSLPERNRFIRGLRSWVGFKQVPIYYERDARYAGEVKYSFRKLIGLGLNGIVSFSSFPLRLATYLGFLTCFAGLLYVTYAVSAYVIYHQSPQGWTSLTVLVLLVGGVQLVLLGAIGEYISKMYDEVKKRPNYIIREFYD